jgi:hypothetical protein
MAGGPMTGFMCIVPGCGRSPPASSAICVRCQKWISIENKLALHGHLDARRSADGHSDLQAWRAFVDWSHQRTVEVCALEAWSNRPEAPTDQPTLAHVVRLKQGLGLL